MQSIKKKRQRNFYPTKYYRDRKFFFENLKRNVNVNVETSKISSDIHVDNSVICTDSDSISIESSSSNGFESPCQSNLALNELSDSDTSETDDLGSVEKSTKPTLQNDLQQWALKYKVNHNAISALLGILGEHKECVFLLPRNSRTLLKTPRSVEIEEIAGGKLWYHGIKECLQQSIIAKLQQNETLLVNFSMDGLPLHKSTAAEFWPILMNIVDMPEVRPMVVAIFLGRSKPLSLEQYLRRFVIDLNDTQRNGIYTKNGANIKIKLNSFIADAPARSYIKGLYFYI